MAIDFCGFSNLTIIDFSGSKSKGNALGSVFIFEGYGWKIAFLRDINDENLKLKNSSVFEEKGDGKDATFGGAGAWLDQLKDCAVMTSSSRLFK